MHGARRAALDHAAAMPHPLVLPVTTPAIVPEVPDDELHYTYVRSSGAGGQNVNKVSSKAVLRWRPAASQALSAAVKERFVARYASRLTGDGDLLITSELTRDQGRNADDCLAKLRALIATVLVAPVERRATRPTFGSKKRTERAQKARSEIKKSRRSGWD